MNINVFSTLVVLKRYPASVEFNFETFMYVVSEKPHGDTMCQIKNRIWK